MGQSRGFTYQYNNRLQRWQNPVNGQMVSEANVIAEMRRHQNATYTALDALTDSLYNGNINIAQWQAGVAQELKDAHLAQAMFGVGGKHNMTFVEYGRVGGTLRDEYRYLARFADDIAAGRQSRAQALARIKQYGNATQQSYWREWSLKEDYIWWRRNASESCGDCVDLESNNPYTASSLPTYPGAGSTRCRGNCKCTLHTERQPIEPVPQDDEVYDNAIR
jgi:hypothetical protein